MSTMEKQVTLIVVLIICIQPLTASIEDAIVAAGSSMSEQYNRQLNIIYGSPYDIPKGNNSDDRIHYKYIPVKNGKLLSCDVDYRNDVLYMYDIKTASIYAVQFHGRQNFTNMTITPFHQGLSRSFVRLAVDWISHNVYWTDRHFNWIAVQSRKQNLEYHPNFKILISDNLKQPTALAVDPIHGLMFWSDIGGKENGLTKIERATLTGGDRQTIINTGLLSPNSMDVDIVESRIYWVDNERDTIQSADFNGNDKMIIRRLSNYEFIDVAIFGSIVTVIEYRKKRLMFFNKINGNSVRNTVTLPYTQLYSLALYSLETQPLIDDSCDPSACSDICATLASGPKCLCREGYQLQEDGTTCSEKEGQFARAIVIATASSMCLTDLRLLTTVKHWENTTTCVFNSSSLSGHGEEITAFDLDMTERKIIFSTQNNIYSMDMVNYVPTRIISTTKQITDLALDWLDKNIYWSMGTSPGAIMVVSQKTPNSEYAIIEDLQYPQGLALMPLERRMMWISGTTDSHLIERSDMDGTGRTTIITSGLLVSPIALTVDIDKHRIYWTDSGHVRTSKLDGTDLKTLLLDEDVFSPKHLFVYKEFLVLTEDVTDGSYIISVRDNKVKFTNHGNINGIRVLDPVLQPEQYGPCEVENGGCEHICLPVGQVRWCQCDYGFQLDANKLTCSSVPLMDDFLYVTDWTHSRIYQVSLRNTSDVRGLNTAMIKNPIGVAYNHRTKQVVIGDTSDDSVHVVNADGTDYMVVSNIGVHMAYPSRLAIDSTSGNIFYTAVGRNGSESWVGVISPSGLHRKLIVYIGKPRDIVLEPSKGVLFWSDHNGDSPFVKRADMDGANEVTIVTSNIRWPNGLAIDYKAELLYLSDGGLNTIQRCTYLGQCNKLFQDYNNAHIMDISLMVDFLYFTAWNRDSIIRLNKTDVTSVERVAANADFGRLDALTMYSSSADPQPVSLACFPNNGRGPCSTFCLPTSGTLGYTCACEDGISLQADGKTCRNVVTTRPMTIYTQPSTTLTTTRTSVTDATFNDDDDDDNDDGKVNRMLPIISGGSAGVVVVLIGIIVVVVLTLKRRSRARKSSSSGQRVEERTRTQDGPDSVYNLINFDNYETSQTHVNEEPTLPHYERLSPLQLAVRRPDTGVTSLATSASTAQGPEPCPAHSQLPLFTDTSKDTFNGYISPTRSSSNH